MKTTYTITALSLLALAGCNLIGKGTARLGGGSSPTTTSATGVPQVTPDAKDSSSVRNALAELDAMEQLIAEKNWKRYARESRNFQSRARVTKTWDKEPKERAILERMDALDAAAFKAFGGRLVAIPSGTRTFDGVKPDALSAANDMIDACEAAAEVRGSSPDLLAKNLGAALATYEKHLARVKKIDANALRFMGDVGPRNTGIDVPTKLLTCEAGIAELQTDVAETYQEEVAAGEAAVEVGCGMITWLADGVRVGPNKFAPYRRTAGGNSFVEKVACSKIPKKDKVPAALATATKEFRAHISNKNMVIVVDGPSYVEVDDDDYTPHRYQKLLAYSKTFELAANPCGELKVFCEAGGSKGAGGYNRLEFALDRAAAHAGVKPDMCRRHLDDAKRHAAWFAELHAELVKNKQWIAGATYRTKKGVKLAEKAFIAAFAAKGKLAEDRRDDGYCDRKPAR